MNQSQAKWTPINVSVVILTTLKDIDGPAITGVMYAAMLDRIDIHTFTSACDLLARAGFIKRNGAHQIELTAEGRKAAEEADEALKIRNQA